MFDFSEINRNSFDELSAINDTLFDITVPLQNKLSINFEEFIKKLNIEGNKVLDIGCGTGDLALYLGNCGYNVTAIDFSDKMLIAARNKLRVIKEDIAKRNEMVKHPDFVKCKPQGALLSSINPKIKFICDDITDLKNIYEQFNVVVMLDCLSYVIENKIINCIENLKKIIYKNGYVTFLYFTELSYKNRKNFQKKTNFFNYEAIYEYNETEKIMKTIINVEKNDLIRNSLELTFYEKIYSLEFLNELLNKNGFKITKMIPDTAIFVSDDGNINEIIDKIKETYSMPNGVNRILIAAQKI